MQVKNVMDAVSLYLKEQEISNIQILRDTKIDISSNKSLDASEFLKLCKYLRKKPEDFEKMMEGIENDSVSL